MSSQDGHVEGGVGRGRDHGRFVDELRNGVAIDVICIEGEGEIGLKKTQDPDVAQRCLLSGKKERTTSGDCNARQRTQRETDQ